MIQSFFALLRGLYRDFEPLLNFGLACKIGKYRGPQRLFEGGIGRIERFERSFSHVRGECRGVRPEWNGIPRALPRCMFKNADGVRQWGSEKFALAVRPNPGLFGRMKWTWTGLRTWAVLGLLAGWIGCMTVPETGRRQFNLMSSGEEMQLGFSEFDKMKKQVPLNKDPKLNAMVERVGKRIAAVASPSMPEAQWEFVVFESKDANAFCLPGGKVGVYTGIFPITQTEEGLATVIGHEVAHAVARHGGERMSTAMALNVIGTLGGAAAAKSRYAELFNQLYAPVTQVGVALPHSRGQESEADRIGLLYMARAGYRPEAAVEFWQRFGEYNRRQGNQTPWFLRTHPLDDARVAELKQRMPEARAQFKAQ